VTRIIVVAISLVVSGWACNETKAFVAKPRLALGSASFVVGSGTSFPADILFIGDTHASNPLAGHHAISDNTAIGERITHVALRPPHLDVWGQEILAWTLAHNRDVKLVVHLGDAANIGCTNELDRFLAVMNGQPRLWVMAPGNHDSLMLGNFAIDRFEGGRWGEECRNRDSDHDEHMDKNAFLERYIAAQNWVVAPSSKSECIQFTPAARGGPRIERAIACAYSDSPHASFIVQQVAMSPRLTMFVLDTSVYSAPPSLTHNGGSEGGLGTQQSAILDAWLADEGRTAAPRSVMFVGHVALDHLDPDSKAQLAEFVREYPVLGYVSAHEHDPTKQLLHPEPATPAHAFPELNVASLLDWPMEYVRASFTRTEEVTRLEFEVRSAAEELDSEPDSNCRAAAALHGPDGTKSWRVSYSEKGDSYTAYVPFRWYNSLTFWRGNRAYDILRAKMYHRLGELLGMPAAGVAGLMDRETHGKPSRDPALLRYERCQVRWASEEESCTRRGAKGNEINWPAPTIPTQVRPTADSASCVSGSVSTGPNSKRSVVWTWH
jgi:hypothetical protein